MQNRNLLTHSINLLVFTETEQRHNYIASIFTLFSLFGNLPYCIIVDDGEDDDRCHGQIAGSQNNIHFFSLSPSSRRTHPFSHLMCTYVTIASHTCEVRSVTRQKNSISIIPLIFIDIFS